MPRPKDPNKTHYVDKRGYKRDRDKHTQYIMKRRDDKKSKLIEYFGNACHDCKDSFPPCCYDFHHLDPSAKSFEIAPRLDGNIDTIMEEVKKCIMLCSNCHRIRHYKETR